jgi:hypothetical protein
VSRAQLILEKQRIRDGIRIGFTTYTRAMLVDRALRSAFRNFSTLWLIVAGVTFPLHLAHGYAFRDVVAVTELHGAIERFPPYRQVEGVSAADLADARRWYVVVTAVEILSLPLLGAAAQRALEEEGRGGVPGALRSWAGVARPRPAAQLRHPAAVAAGAAVSLLIGWLVEVTGRLLLEPAPEQLLWLGGAVVAAGARATAAPFTLAALATSALEAGSGERSPARR